VPLSRSLPQQHHKPVFKPRLHWSSRDSSEQAICWRTAVTLSGLRPDEAHMTTLWHCVNHTRIIEQVRLQPAGRLPGARFGQPRAASR